MIVVEMVKVVRFLHGEPREFSDYMWHMREREMYQRYLQALSLIYSKDGVLSTEMGRLCVEVLRKN